MEQDNERTSADAADTDHLACHVDDFEALQQLAPIFLQRGPIGTELLVDHLFHLIGRVAVHGLKVAGRDHHGRLTDDPVTTIDDFAKLGQRLEAVTRVGLLRTLPGPLGGLSHLASLLLAPRFFGQGADGAHELFLGQPGVPDVHVAHLGELGHGLAICRHRRECRRRGVGGTESVISPGDGEARSHSHNVVLERTRQGLVEVVQIEEQGPLRRCECAEIR